MDVVDPSKMPAITGAATFISAINIPGYEISVIDTEMQITFPGSDYAGKYFVPIVNHETRTFLFSAI